MKKNIAIITLSILLCSSIVFSVIILINKNNISKNYDNLKIEYETQTSAYNDLSILHSDLQTIYNNCYEDLNEMGASYKENIVRCALLEFYYSNVILKASMNTIYQKLLGSELEEYLPYKYDDAVPLYPSDVYERYYKEGMSVTDIDTISFD